MPGDRLTRREDQVRGLVSDGLGTEEVAARLGISPRTVESHLHNAYRKLGVHRREDLAAVGDDSTDGVSSWPAYEDEVRRLKETVAEKDRHIEAYAAAFEKIIDRQFPLFDERVELTVAIGRRSSEDMVVERHWTAPKRYLTYRVIRPISPKDASYDWIVSTMSIACDVVGADVGIAVQVVPDFKGRPRAIILFQPGLEQPTEWILRYRTPGLWDPLREKGHDELRWAPGRLDGDSAASINDLTVHVNFPPGTAGASLVEAGGVGEVSVAEPDSPGAGTRITYRDFSRAGAKYDFVLGMAVDG